MPVQPPTKPVAQLTTASYALLGLLDLQPFSAYELTKYMKRSALAHLWPRTEASLYKEPKVLVAHGYASASVAANGARERTVYSITPEGRSAFRDWLREPGGMLGFECEAAVKVFFGDATDLQTLRHLLAVLAEHPERSSPPPLELLAAFRDGQVHFAHRVQYTAIAADLIAHVNLAVAAWAESWLKRTETWQGTSLDDSKRAQAHAVLDEIAGQLARRTRTGSVAGVAGDASARPS